MLTIFFTNLGERTILTSTCRQKRTTLYLRILIFFCSSHPSPPPNLPPRWPRPPRLRVNKTPSVRGWPPSESDVKLGAYPSILPEPCHLGPNSSYPLTWYRRGAGPSGLVLHTYGVHCYLTIFTSLIYPCESPSLSGTNEPDIINIVH